MIHFEKIPRVHQNKNGEKMAENRHSIEERVELSLLYDFYGALLKENQRRMFEGSILDDYNLAEIAEDENITRQGVHDAIKRACKQLREYEQKLGLVEKFEKQKELVKKLHIILKGMNIGDEGELEEVYSIIDRDTRRRIRLLPKFKKCQEKYLTYFFCCIILFKVSEKVLCVQILYISICCSVFINKYICSKGGCYGIR